METEAKIRRLYFNKGMSIGALVRELKISRNTVRKVIRAGSAGQTYNRSKNQPLPKLGAVKEKLEEWLAADAMLSKKERRTAMKYYQELQECGYEGGYNMVQRFVKKWREHKEGARQAFVPMSFDPGEAYQFDWSEEFVELGGMVCKVKVAHFRLCYSRKSFVMAYLRETQEMLFDAHNKAFEFFGGLTLRGIYDNMKTAVDTIFIGKEKKFNLRFLALMDHFLIEPTACNPAAGWEKGQVEKQVNEIRKWFFTPRLKFNSLEELNTHLNEQCQRIAKERKHPEFKGQSIGEVFLAEKPKLKEQRAPFAAYREVACKITSTCLIRYDTNSYSVYCSHANKAATIRAYADRIDVFYGDEQIATHARTFKRYETVLNPFHYLPLVNRKPGILRNGAPFKNWDLPKPILQIKEKLMKRKGGDRETADILLAMSEYGMEEVSVACDLAIQDKAISRDNIINILNRLRNTGECEQIKIPEVLMLKEEPASDCTRYNLLIANSVGGSNATC